MSFLYQAQSMNLHNDFQCSLLPKIEKLNIQKIPLLLFHERNREKNICTGRIRQCWWKINSDVYMFIDCLIFSLSDNFSGCFWDSGAEKYGNVPLTKEWKRVLAAEFMDDIRGRWNDFSSSQTVSSKRHALDTTAIKWDANDVLSRCTKGMGKLIKEVMDIPMHVTNFSQLKKSAPQLSRDITTDTSCF